MVLYISTLGHARKLKFSRVYVNVTSVNQIFQYRHIPVTLGNVGEVYNFEHGLYISPLKHARLLILSSYVLLASINTIYKYCLT